MRHPVTIFNETGSSLGETYDMAKFSNTYRRKREISDDFYEYENKGDYDGETRGGPVSRYIFESGKFQILRKIQNSSIW